MYRKSVLSNGVRVITDGTKIRGKSILVATGVEYRRLDVPRLSEFEGAGVYYAATDTETKLCRNEEVVVVGAGNSAGQAIVALSRYARRVHVVTRGRDLGKSSLIASSKSTMSRFTEAPS